MEYSCGSLVMQAGITVNKAVHLQKGAKLRPHDRK